MNTNQISTKIFKARSLYAKNLTSHEDENFKVVQIIELEDGTVMFDIRETIKGKFLPNGVTLYIPEFIWFKKAISNPEINIQLEHNTRLIKVNKAIDSISITLRKTNGKMKTLNFSSTESKNIIDSMQIIEENLIALTEGTNIALDFAEVSYCKESLIM